jgi:hypothetical protein
MIMTAENAGHNTHTQAVIEHQSIKFVSVSEGKFERIPRGGRVVVCKPNLEIARVYLILS